MVLGIVHPHRSLTTRPKISVVINIVVVTAMP